MNDLEIARLCVEISGYKIINDYKPPPSRMTLTAVPIFPQIFLYAGDFNSQYVEWDYKTNNDEGLCLTAWKTTVNLSLFYDPERPTSFLSGGWATEANPVLTFSNADNSFPVKVFLRNFYGLDIDPCL